MLIDRAKIYVFGGGGGNGCQSLYKDIFNRRGVPDGGDGGAGGDIVIEASPNLHTLLDFKYNQHHRAGGGKHGSSSKKYGKRGEDRVLRVPVGTIVKDEGSGLVIRDLAHPGERVIVAKGGAGGKGNAKLREATPGEPGEQRTVLLELKLVADVGIIGFPNSGKSTLICRVSKAHSKIAPYPFTTRSPKLGVVKFHDDTFIMADMPGLIEGAHEGRGLGDLFLRHIERTRVLVHLVDMAPADDSDPAENFLKIEKELELYGNNVYDKPRVVAANKMDLAGAEVNYEKFVKATGKDALAVSALTGEGLKELINAIYGKLKDVEKEDQENNDQGGDQGPYRQG